jgi:hypothetical protein
MRTAAEVAPVTGAPAELSRARLVVLAVLGCWLLTPFLLLGSFAQDAVPFVAAGEVVREHPDQVYADDLYDLPPEFADASCRHSPTGTDCDDENVAFVSLPAALPLSVGLAGLGSTIGPLALRLLGAVALVVGMLALRRRLLVRHPDAEGVLAAVLVLLTPLFMVTMALGQTSPLLFASAALGLALAGGGRRVGIALGVLWGLTVALKLTPVVLVAVLVARRRWTVLAAGAGTVVLLSVAALPFGGVEMWFRFVEASTHLQEAAASNPYNGSIDGALNALAPALTGTPTATALVGAVRLLAIAAVVVVARRTEDEDAQWSFVWLGTLLLVPLVWWHYLWLAPAALVVALCVTRARGRLADPRLLVPLAAATIPLSLVNGTADAQPALQFVVLAAALLWAGYLLLARPTVA